MRRQPSTRHDQGITEQCPPTVEQPQSRRIPHVGANGPAFAAFADQFPQAACANTPRSRQWKHRRPQASNPSHPEGPVPPPVPGTRGHSRIPQPLCGFRPPWSLITHDAPCAQPKPMSTSSPRSSRPACAWDRNPTSSAASAPPSPMVARHDVGVLPISSLDAAGKRCPVLQPAAYGDHTGGRMLPIFQLARRHMPKASSHQELHGAVVQRANG